MPELKVVYHPDLIALSFGIGFFGAFCGVSLCEQFRLSSARGKGSVLWLWLVACSFGGVCIWGTHFIGLASFKLMLDDVEIPVRFELKNVIYLLFIELYLTFVSVYVASTDDCFNRSTKEIMEKFISRASATYSLGALKHMSQFQMFYIVFTHSIHRTIAGGMIAGAALIIMHYIGMLGFKFQGKVTQDGGIVAAACITAVVAIVGGFWIFFRVLSLFPSLDVLRIICGICGMMAISGLHFIGLQGATFHYDPDSPPPDPHTTIDQNQMLVAVMVTTVLVSFFLLVYVLSDLRGWLLRISTRLRQAESTIESVQKECVNHIHTPGCTQINRDTTRYLRKYVYKKAPGERGFDGESKPRQLYNDVSDDDDNNSVRSCASGISSPHASGLNLRAMTADHSADHSADQSAGSRENSVYLTEINSPANNIYDEWKIESLKNKPPVVSSPRGFAFNNSFRNSPVLPFVANEEYGCTVATEESLVNTHGDEAGMLIV